MSKVTLTIAFLFLAGLGSLLGAEPPTSPFLATVTGTVIKQEITTPGSGRIRTSTLNNKRIFQEFQVSPDDYSLVVTNAVSLVLAPKSASSGKPEITVFTLGELSIFLDTKLNAGRFISGAATSTAAANLFEDLSGSAQGRFQFIPPFESNQVKKISFNFVGRGTDISMENGNALLQFKVTSGKSFVQKP